MVRVDLKFFGPLRDVTGKEAFVLDVPSPHTGHAAFETLLASFPGMSRWEPALRLAVNLEYVPFDHVLRSGDEVCLIPPVSGG